jgi:hypothetical protein
MSQLDTAVGTVANVTVSPQPSLVTDIITSASPVASPQSAATNPYADPQGTPGIQGNAPIAAVKTTVGYTGNSTSAAQVSIAFANPA